MSARVSEAIILRSYPLREADLIVSFFTRDHGKLRGVARSGRRPGNRFGSGLERLSYVKMFYFQRENRELVTLDTCDLIRSQFALAGHYETTVALDYLAEVSEQLLPAAEPSERYFRLLLSVTDHLRREAVAGVWPAVTYFSLWAVRLSGFLPELPVGEEDRRIAEEMLRTPVSGLAPRPWSRQTGASLRRTMTRLIEEHCERKLVSAQHLETL